MLGTCDDEVGLDENDGGDNGNNDKDDADDGNDEDEDGDDDDVDIPFWIGSAWTVWHESDIPRSELERILTAVAAGIALQLLFPSCMQYLEDQHLDRE